LPQPSRIALWLSVDVPELPARDGRLFHDCLHWHVLMLSCDASLPLRYGAQLLRDVSVAYYIFNVLTSLK
jgi:hypothetical protein